MGVYLAWSVYKLVGVILVATISLYFGLRYMDKVDATKSAESRDKLLTWWNKLALHCLLLVVVIISSLNIGHKQSELKRSNFNSTTSTEVIVKKDVDTLNSDKVQSHFKLKLQEKQQNESN